MRAAWILTALVALVPMAAQGQVKASLVAPETSIQPGRPFTVALRMEHEPHWHSYWLNAGTGYPTRLKWELPAGWTAGEIQWPTPILIKDSHGTVTGHGYDGVLYLQVPVTPAADAKPGQSITLKAAASWLMCADICIPGSQDVSLTLPVSTDAPRQNAAVQAGIAKMPMPHDARGWKVAAVRDDDSVALHVAGTDEVRDPHFYSESEFIQYDAPQNVAGAGVRATVRMRMVEDPQIPEKLVGLLAYTDAAGAYRGLKVDAPFTSAESAIALVGPVPSGSGANGSAAGSVSGAAKAGAGGLSLRVLALALIGGLILNLMPCVFPVLGIKVVGFVEQAGGDRRKVTMHGLTFTAGVLASFWVLAAILAVLRAGGQELGWGFQLQSASFVFVLSVVMLVFAMSLSGVFDFGLRATGVGAGLQMKEGYSGSFFAGVLATVVATPCSAPFLAPALGAALALSIAESFVVFTFIAIGLSIPYLLLSAFPGAIGLLPRPGRWMETFKQVMAFPLYATVGYLVWVLAGQTSENGLLAALFGLTVIAMGVWLYGRYSAPGVSRGSARFAFGGALALLVLGLYLGWPQAAKASDIAWEPWSAERIAELRKEGRPIYVDFTARWCATCQANKKIVFGSEKVRKAFQDRRIALLKADWTNSDPKITAELARWGRSAVPFNLVYLPGSPQPKPLPEILTPSIVLDAVGER